MKKTAQAGHFINKLIAERWSPRAWLDKPVEASKLLSMLEAARWAPSSANEQPWAFIVARREEPEAFAKLLGCLVPGNQVWAKAAPVLIISVVRKNSASDGTPNRTALHDVGLASENMVLEAVDQGLCSHGMAGIDLEKIRVEYALPEDCEAVAAWAVGYGGEPDQLEGKLKERELAPRTRKELGEFVFGMGWGEKAGIVG
jgi:nitroreductase